MTDAPEDNPYVRDPPTEFEPVEALDETTAREQADQLREAIRYHDYRYYVEADPLVGDRTYDALFTRLETLEDAFDLSAEDSPTRRVGGEPVDAFETVEHVAPMLSIDSSGEEADVREFDERIQRRVGDQRYVCEPKFDGVSIEELNAKLETFQEGLGNAWDAIDDLEEQLEEERAERRRLEEENEKLRNRLDELDARTNLLRLVENSDDLASDQRQIALIQHLKQGAERERERGREAKASVNREEADAALKYPDIDRTTIYDDMRRAAALVENDKVLRYESASGGESRLKLNLEAGDLPTSVVGQPTNHGGR